MGSSRWFHWDTHVAVGVHPAHHLDVARRVLRDEMLGIEIACGHHRTERDLGTGLGSFDEPAEISTMRTMVLQAAGGAASVAGSGTPALEVMGRAVCADRAAEVIAARTGASVLVDIGGYLATRGPVPPGGWWVRVATGTGADDSAHDLVLALRGGAMASSGPLIRMWDGEERPLQRRAHPAGGAPSQPPWRLVTVAAESCAEAAAWVLAAHAWGACARSRVALRGLPARLVSDDGVTTVLGSWIDADRIGAHPAGSARAPRRAGSVAPGHGRRQVG